MTHDTIDPEENESRRSAGQWSELVLTLLIFAVIVTFFIATLGSTSSFAQANSGRGPFFFPRIVLALLLLALPFAVPELRHRPRPLPPSRPLWRMLFLIVATGLYCGLIGVAGFLIASVLFAFVVPLLLGQRGAINLFIVALLYSAAVWLLFERVFLIVLPSAPWSFGF